MSLAPLLIGAFAFNFNNFAVIDLVTEGGPPTPGSATRAGQTDILISYTYRLAFAGGRGPDHAFAAAISPGASSRCRRMSRLPARIAFAPSRPALARRVDIGLKVLVSSAAVVYALFPVAWIVSAALGPSNSLVNQELIPRGATLDNFLRLVNDPQHPFLLWIWNSIKISGIGAILIVALTALAAYSFSRFRYRGRRTGLGHAQEH